MSTEGDSFYILLARGEARAPFHPVSYATVENRCRSKKNVNYHNILLSCQNDQTAVA